MRNNKPHMKLYKIRCTLLAFHALVWSFLWYSRPEFNQTSSNVSNVDRELSNVSIVGAVFLGGTAFFTFVGLTMHSPMLNYIFIISHTLGIVLTVVSILNYWSVNLLWIPAVLASIIPFCIELVNAILIAVGKSQHF